MENQYSYDLSLNILRALGGDMSIQYDNTDQIWAAIDTIYAASGDGIDLQELALTITENGMYDYTATDTVDAYVPVHLDVNIEQKYTDEQVEQLKRESYTEGYAAGDDAGYKNGVEMGIVLQKSELIDITISENGTYERENGYKKVIVETASSGGGSGFDFGVIGYDSQLSNECNSVIADDIAYSKSIYDKWVPNSSSAAGFCLSDTKLIYAPNFDLTGCKDTSRMFRGCLALTTIPLLNTSSVTNMSYMFDGCSLINTIPLLDTSLVINMSNMFYNCSKLTAIPELNTSSVTIMISMFQGCSSLNTIPLFDTSNVTTMNNMFHTCSSLNTIPQLNTSSVTNMSYMFYNCSKLTAIPELNCSSVTNISRFLSYSSNITTLTDLGGFLNLGMQADLTGTNDTYFLYRAPNITYESIMNVINKLYDRATAGYSVLTLKLNANTLALLSEDDIAIATNKGWTLA